MRAANRWAFAWFISRSHLAQWDLTIMPRSFTLPHKVFNAIHWEIYWELKKKVFHQKIHLAVNSRAARWHSAVLREDEKIKLDWNLLSSLQSLEGRHFFAGKSDFHYFCFRMLKRFSIPLDMLNLFAVQEAALIFNLVVCFWSKFSEKFSREQRPV